MPVATGGNGELHAGADRMRTVRVQEYRGRIKKWIMREYKRGQSKGISKSAQINESIKLPASSVQPSIKTKNRTLKGSDMTVGGSIIMPIDMVTVATTMSITRNGRAIRKPISDHLRNSEIMNAGARTRKSLGARSAPIPESSARSTKNASSFSRTFFCMNCRNGVVTRS